MSNGGQVHPRSPEWWQASDGLWYPPEQQPGRLPPPPAKQKRITVLPASMSQGVGLGCGLILAVVLAVLAWWVLEAFFIAWSER